jgi:hypothetical protein
MSKQYQIGGEMVPYQSTHKGGTAAACGTASTQITIPAGANSALIHAEGAAIYWKVNGTSAGSTSPGYVAADQTGFVLTCDNLSRLDVAGASAAAVAHVEFYQD